MKRVFSRNF